MPMSTLVRLLAPIVGAVVGLGACTTQPAPVVVRLSVGRLALSVPQDAKVLNLGRQRLVSGVCHWVSTLHMAEYAPCRYDLAVESVHGVEGSTESTPRRARSHRSREPAAIHEHS